jgi:hypothetical protein
MPDISMCKGGSCPDKEQCYRYTATPSHWQSYANFMDFPGNGKHKKCDYYLKIKKEQK